MPCTIGFWHHTSGVSGLTVQLYGLATGGIVNGTGGDALSEPNAANRPRYYEASVTETVAGGVYKAQVLKSGTVIYDGLVRITGTGTAVIDEGAEHTVLELSTQAIAQLAGERAIIVSIPTLVGNQLSQPLVRGDSYLAEHGRAIEFSREDFPDLTGEETVTLTARGIDQSVPVSFSLLGTIATASGSKVLRFEPTSAHSAEWEPGKYEFDVEVNFGDGNVATFVGPNSFLRVLADVTGN